MEIRDNAKTFLNLSTVFSTRYLQTINRSRRLPRSHVEEELDKVPREEHCVAVDPKERCVFAEFVHISVETHMARW